MFLMKKRRNASIASAMNTCRPCVPDFRLNIILARYRRRTFRSQCQRLVQFSRILSFHSRSNLSWELYTVFTRWFWNVRWLVLEVKGASLSGFDLWKTQSIFWPLSLSLIFAPNLVKFTTRQWPFTFVPHYLSKCCHGKRPDWFKDICQDTDSRQAEKSGWCLCQVSRARANSGQLRSDYLLFTGWQLDLGQLRFLGISCRWTAFAERLRRDSRMRAVGVPRIMSEQVWATTRDTRVC